MSQEIVTDVSGPRLIAALEDHRATFWGFITHGPKAMVHDEPDLMYYSSGWTGDVELNQVARARFSVAEADRRIQQVVEVFRDRGVPLTWTVLPSSRPHDLGERLCAHGFELAWIGDGMSIDVASLDGLEPLPSGLRVEPVEDEDGLRDWV